MLAGIAGCSSTTKDPAVIYQNQSEAQIFHEGEISLAKGRYAVAVQQFEALDALYPFGPNDEQAELDLMYVYYQTEDMASAAATANRFIRLYPRSEHADYAYYMKGLADFNQNRGWLQRFFPTDLAQRDPGTTKQAFDDFNHLLQYFPDSVYAPDARQRMVYLRNLFAQYEVEVGQYYFNRGAYVAAANRGAYVLQHYQGTLAVQNALGLMAQSYRNMGMNDLAVQTLQTLAINYPNGPVLRALEKQR